jgi:hypothetical protein
MQKSLAGLCLDAQTIPNKSWMSVRTSYVNLEVQALALIPRWRRQYRVASGFTVGLPLPLFFSINLFPDAGLTSEERDIITKAYENGVLKVIVATCSLGAGINLPARRVILHGARMGRDLIAPSMLYVHI